MDCGQAGHAQRHPSGDVDHGGGGDEPQEGEHGGAVRESFRNKNPGSITARVTTDGVLWIDQPHMFLVGKWLHRDNWHVGDFNLFWGTSATMCTTGSRPPRKSEVGRN